MWLLSYLSDMLIHAMVIIGIVGTLASFFIPTNPLTAQYGILTKVVSIVILCVGIFFEGTIFKDKIWEARIAEAQIKIAEAEKQSAEANSKIQYVYITKKQQVESVKQATQSHIKTDAEKIDSFCMVIPDVVEILNTSAKNDSGVKK